MEDKTMALAKIKNDLLSSEPAMFNDPFSRSLMDWGLSNFASTDSTLPAVNVREDDEAYHVEVASPGMKRDDFKVDYQNGRLNISSEKKEERKEEKEGTVTRREFNYESFHRSFTVPESMVKVDDISAKYTDGILYVTMPKTDEAKPRPPKSINIS